MEKIKVSYSFENSVATVLMDDGKGNVLDHIMMEDLQNIFNSFAGKNEIKLIVLEGAGKHFSFGASVEEHRQELAAAMLGSFHRLF